MKTCSRRLMAKHATAQNNPVKPRRTGVQQELEEKTNLRKRSRNGTQVQKHGRNALEKNLERTAHVCQEPGNPYRKRRTGNSPEPKDKGPKV